MKKLVLYLSLFNVFTANCMDKDNLNEKLTKNFIEIQKCFQMCLIRLQHTEKDVGGGRDWITRRYHKCIKSCEESIK